MSNKSVSPSVSQTAFNCPYCGAYTTQYWFKVYADRLTQESGIPSIPTREMIARVQAASELDADTKRKFVEWIEMMDSGLVFFEQNKSGSHIYIYNDVHNLFLSLCYNCQKVAVWVHQSLVFPPQKSGPEPNPDIPDTILYDYEEARSILNVSPRGAAALLRLCVQKLCAFLGEKGKHIDDDIASLVAKGLNPLVQKSLDVVRVVGNEAVHPGVIDLKDDRDIALRLLDLVNIIADQMITHPKTVEQMYDKLPDAKRKAIEERNKKALNKQ